MRKHCGINSPSIPVQQLAVFNHFSQALLTSFFGECQSWEPWKTLIRSLSFRQIPLPCVVTVESVVKDTISDTRASLGSAVGISCTTRSRWPLAAAVIQSVFKMHLRFFFDQLRIE